VFLRQDTAHTSSNSLEKSGPRWKREPANIRHRIETSSARRSSCWRPRGSATILSLRDSIHRARSSVNGATVSSKTACRALRKSLEAGAQPAFPPSVVVDVKRLACELPSHADVPLGALHHPRTASGGARPRHRGANQRRHVVALVERRCAATLAASQLDLSPRSPVRRESRPCPGFVWPNLETGRIATR